MFLQPAQVWIEPVGHSAALSRPPAFDRIEFRTVGRQRQQPEIGQVAHIVNGQMEAGMVGDHHMQRLRIQVGDLFEEERVDVPVDGGGEQQLGGVRTVDFQRLVQITPLVASGVGRVDAHATPGQTRRMTGNSP